MGVVVGPQSAIFLKIHDVCIHHAWKAIFFSEEGGGRWKKGEAHTHVQGEEGTEHTGKTREEKHPCLRSQKGV